MRFFQYLKILQTIQSVSYTHLTKEVPIKCTTTGSPAGGKSVLGVELSEESVMLKGNAEALNNITSKPFLVKKQNNFFLI